MAIKFPRFRPKNDDIIEFEDLNESLQTIIEETSGRLNEHNFATPTTTQGDLSVDVCRMYNGRVYDFIFAGGFPSVNTYAFPYQQAWVVIDGLSKTFTSQGGLLWILASLQQYSTNFACRIFYGIRVNGQLIPETVVGSMDPNGTEMGPFMTTPVCVELIIPVPPGEVLIEVMGNARAIFSNPRVATRELIVLEFPGG